MLKSLFIRNYALIDALDIRFEDGFSVITGETGAGKSIILGALSLVLGERADIKSIQTGKDKCAIEAVFDLSTYHLERFFEENDLEYDATECMFRRELHRSGKSRAFINDSPVSLSVVKELGDRLIDVHSQHRNLLLADTHFQLNVVDLMAQSQNQLSEYRNEYQEYLSVCDALAGLKEQALKTKNEEDFIRFQHDELSEAKLKAGEQEELEQERETLSHAEEIKTALYRVTGLLDGENTVSAVSALKEALAVVEQLEDCFPKAVGYAERLRNAYFDILDLASETGVLKDDVDFNPERLEWIHERLNIVYSLLQKHKLSSVAELIARREDLSAQLIAIDSFDEELEALERRRKDLYGRLTERAAGITGLRISASERIEQQILERLLLVGMPNARFQLAFTSKDKLSPDGADEVAFLFSANKNEPLKPVAQTASGGEISRLMLCVKAMIADYAALPSIIFDEIDAGISGEVADKTADIMQDLGRKMQVITITHLPQVAAKGNAHYFVYKEDTPERTYTRIRRLDDPERIDEIARMLSGAQVTRSAVDNARVLLGL
jgi:DNA repair protein RecN (Recombination protein N)